MNIVLPQLNLKKRTQCILRSNGQNRQKQISTALRQQIFDIMILELQLISELNTQRINIHHQINYNIQKILEIIITDKDVNNMYAHENIFNNLLHFFEKHTENITKEDLVFLFLDNGKKYFVNPTLEELINLFTPIDLADNQKIKRRNIDDIIKTNLAYYDNGHYKLQQQYQTIGEKIHENMDHEFLQKDSYYLFQEQIEPQQDLQSNQENLQQYENPITFRNNK